MCRFIIFFVRVLRSINLQNLSNTALHKGIDNQLHGINVFVNKKTWLHIYEKVGNYLSELQLSIVFS